MLSRCDSVHYSPRLSIGLLFFALFILGGVVIFLGQTLSFSMIQSMAVEARQWVDHYLLYSIFLFAFFYFLICCFPIPFISAFTMLSGYFFGNMVGLLVVSFMSALGCTVLFLITRYGLRRWVNLHFGERLQQITGIHTDGFTTALSLRLIPGMPFSIPSITLGLGQLNVLTFYWATQIGLLPILFVYVNAGRSLSEVQSVGDVLSIQLIVSMLLLALVPFLLRLLQQEYINRYSFGQGHRKG